MLTPAEAKTKIEQVKEKYPDAVKSYSTDAPNNGYCVGGAFCTYGFEENTEFEKEIEEKGLIDNSRAMLSEMRKFPLVEELATTIVKYNAQLSTDDALKYAEDVIDANDTGNFTLAWNTLILALSNDHYTRGTSRDD